MSLPLVYLARIHSVDCVATDKPRTTTSERTPKPPCTRLRLTLYPWCFSHSILCLVTGNCLLSPLKLPSASVVKARFNSSWNLFSALAISFTTASAPPLTLPTSTFFVVFILTGGVEGIGATPATIPEVLRRVLVRDEDEGDGVGGRIDADSGGGEMFG
ncbi:hypothetical protein KC340_g87 [Hortaea werneckii]|nr:hypothetical protein KC340_g87 [Hortaea werneckii]